MLIIWYLLTTAVPESARAGVYDELEGEHDRGEEDVGTIPRVGYRCTGKAASLCGSNFEQGMELLFWYSP